MHRLNDCSSVSPAPYARRCVCCYNVPLVLKNMYDLDEHEENDSHTIAWRADFLACSGFGFDETESNLFGFR